ncbi:unnamed protein product [Vicia faba]|uniref:Uncharacterized protein n=1 Tax=Vicia faba TaxID=3906 RepID=A0AAV0Z8I5_VICFA|nr:unnamed protein product [Vicia faba]
MVLVHFSSIHPRHIALGQVWLGKDLHMDFYDGEFLNGKVRPLIIVVGHFAHDVGFLPLLVIPFNFNFRRRSTPEVYRSDGDLHADYCFAPILPHADVRSSRSSRFLDFSEKSLILYKSRILEFFFSGALAWQVNKIIKKNLLVFGRDRTGILPGFSPSCGFCLASFFYSVTRTTLHSTVRNHHEIIRFHFKGHPLQSQARISCPRYSFAALDIMIFGFTKHSCRAILFNLKWILPLNEAVEDTIW